MKIRRHVKNDIVFMQTFNLILSRRISIPLFENCLKGGMQTYVVGGGKVVHQLQVGLEWKWISIASPLASNKQGW
jgi:hypothetical protein